MKKFNRQMSNPLPTDLDPETFIDAASSNDSDASSDYESQNDLAVEHYLSVG